MKKAEATSMLNILLIVMVVFLILTYAMKGAAMSIFSGKEEEVVLFSPMQGVLTFEGKPAAGAKIIRKVNWKDNVGETETFYANEKGEFSLPIKKETAKISGLNQFVAHQKIFISLNKNEYQIWGNGKLDKVEYSEFGGSKPKNLTCEITNDPVRVDTKTGWVVTSCQWDMES